MSSITRPQATVISGQITRPEGKTYVLVPNNQCPDTSSQVVFDCFYADDRTLKNLSARFCLLLFAEFDSSVSHLLFIRSFIFCMFSSKVYIRMSSGLGSTLSTMGCYTDFEAARYAFLKQSNRSTAENLVTCKYDMGLKARNL